jgi:Arc/MetJ-type ribon-helix-helix transcriptional regulator
MEQITFRAPAELLDELEETVESGGYANRSELIRGAVRDELREHRG